MKPPASSPHPRSRRRRTVLLVAVLGAAVVLSACTGAPAPAQPAAPEAAFSITQIVENLAPSVVTIFTDGGLGGGVVYSEDGFILTDARISPGNSGGAVLNMRGEVVGISEAYIPPSAGAVALGFAIPAATAVEIAGELLADGTAEP